MEQMIPLALRRGKYTYQAQAVIGKRPGGKRHKVDYLASREGQKAILISSKYQEQGGTAEEKIPYDVISLIKAIIESEGKFEKAYVVLGGIGWTLRDFYISGGLEQYLKDQGRVKVVSLESFVAMANQGKL